MFYKFFDKKSSSGAIKGKVISNQQLTEELQKPIIRKLKVSSSFEDDIWVADLVDMP